MAENETNVPAAEEAPAIPSKLKKKKKKKMNKWVKRGIALGLIAAVAGGAVVYNRSQKAKEAESEATSQTSVVTRGDITVKITGSGTVTAIDEYNIVPTVNGDIKQDFFAEGDYVNEGDVLYKFDSTVADNAIKTAENQIKTAKNSVTSAQNSIESAETNLQNRADAVDKAQENIDKLTIYANSTGKVSGLSLTVGNDAGGNICTITDTSTRLVKVPFNAAQFSKIAVGDSVTLSIEKYMTTASGTVQRKYSAAGTGSDGSVVYDVEILVGGGVELPEGTIVTANVHTASGDCQSSSAGSVFYPDPTAVNAEVQGKVQRVNVKNGDWVMKGAVIAQLESSTLQDALKTARQDYTNAQTQLEEARNNYQNALTNLENAQSNLEDRQSDADDYTITAPISGVVLSKDYKAGDTIYGQNSTTLMVIADMSKMKFTISVDELDIASIALGQEVDVTSDALEGVELVGRITNISKKGESQNGVTNYPVEVTIDEPGELMSGMNVSAEIIVAEAPNALRVPVSAVSYFEGKHYVTVVGELKGASGGGRGANAPAFGGSHEGAPENVAEGEAKVEAEDEAKGEENVPEGGAAEAGSMPAHESGDADASHENAPNADASAPAGAAPMGGVSGDRSSGSSGGSRRGRSDAEITLFDEERRTEVTVGVTDGDYYEILSGLEEGQVVHDEGSSSSGGFNFGMMMGGMGGPGGGPGGGRPGGGGR